jgi:cell division protein FtsB
MIKFVFRQHLRYLIAAAELSFLIFFYLWAGHGWFALSRLNREKNMIEVDIQRLDTKIKDLNGSIAAFQSSDFGKEKIAREQLHMARPDDIVVYFSER